MHEAGLKEVGNLRFNGALELRLEVTIEAAAAVGARRACLIRKTNRLRKPL